MESRKGKHLTHPDTHNCSFPYSFLESPSFGAKNIDCCVRVPLTKSRSPFHNLSKIKNNENRFALHDCQLHYVDFVNVPSSVQ